MTDALPLTGVRVLDLTSNIAGPYASAVLADLGADVLHVEAPAGDSARRMAPVLDDDSAYFRVVNRGKALTTIDLADPTGSARLHDLIARADVLVTNLKPRRLEAIGLSESSARRSFPRLVYARLTAYGEVGPDRDLPGYDAVVQARTGLCAVTGTRDSGPARVGVSILDMGSGIWLALGVVAALLHRERTGEGVSVGTSLFETGAAWSSYHVAAHELTGIPSTPAGSGHPAFFPYGLFATADHSVALGVNNDGQFRRLCDVLGAGELADDDRYRTNGARLDHREELRTHLEVLLSKAPCSTWLHLLWAADVPADRLQRPEDLLTDPQVAALDLLTSAEVSGQRIQFPASPLRWNGTRVRPAAPVQAE